MAFSTSLCHCSNYAKSLSPHLSFSHAKKRPLKLQSVRERENHGCPETRLSEEEEVAQEEIPLRNVHFVSRFSSNNDTAKRVGAKSLVKYHRRRIHRRENIGSDSGKGEAGDGVRSERLEQKTKEKPSQDSSAATTLRLGLEMCSKRGDIIGAITLYDIAKRDGIKLGHYHYAVLLYLFSSAATGSLQPAKSGSVARTLSPGEPLNRKSSLSFEANGMRNGEDDEPWEEVNTNPPSLCDLVESMKKPDSSKGEAGGTTNRLTENLKRVALKKGFEVHDEMIAERVPMTEPILTSIARMAVAVGDGRMAFDAVKKMKDYGINPRLRSYGPALATFCGNGDVEGAFEVEQHMLENGICPEEPELEALLRLSVEAGKIDRVYYVLHKLRSNVRQVSHATADLIERWFKSKPASRVGRRKPDGESIARAVETNGGGWHGLGWVGSGKWNVSRTNVDSGGFCVNCGEKLATIDLDPEETEGFARSVASIVLQRERDASGFRRFQKWLDYYGPFEAVVDGANVGILSQRTFKPTKVNAVVNGIRQMLPSKKWPLVVLHNRRASGPKMDGPVNKALIEKWRNADALYLTPTGSNDDWYWLYAAIKCRSLIVTNDEMRDHLFQLLGGGFFPRWKERHQVRFGFGEAGPVFHMPPPCSVVIQESERGHWHIPVAMSEDEQNEDARTWLCCTRSGKNGKGGVRNRRDDSVIRQLEGAEKLGGCVVDFQI